VNAKPQVINKIHQNVNKIVRTLSKTLIVKGLTLIYFLLSGTTAFATQKMTEISARQIRPAVQDRGYRRHLESIYRQDPYSFYPVLEHYFDEESDLNRMKIMRGWYEKAGSEPYNLIALMLLMNAWNPTSLPASRLMFEFLQEHFHEPKVLSLFFYRCLPLAQRDQSLSFTNISEQVFGLNRIHVQKNLPGRRGLYPANPKAMYLVFNELEGLHFLDYMLQAEMNQKSFLRIRDLLLELWQRHRLLQTSLYREHKPWFDKVIGFYYGYGPNKALEGPQSLLQTYMAARRHLFCNHGVCDHKHVTDLEDILKVDSLVVEQPEQTNSAKD